MKPTTYSQSGVDIDRGDRFVDFIKRIPSRAISKSIGGFSGSFELDSREYRHPVFMTTTDGVGTKILVAQRLGRFDTIGIDLVAMCVNDLIVCGAQPVTFLDYVACGKIDEGVLREIITGVVSGCEQASCTLGGGETAELPDMYRDGELDLAGFAVGVVEHDRVLPRSQDMHEGDLIMALPSAGIHSNGLSLARRVVPTKESALWEELLKPTKIYAREMKILLESKVVLGAAHITGGGLEGNLMRVLPNDLMPRFNFRWPVPDVFRAIQRFGHVEDAEMRRVFNMGIGIAFVVSADNQAVVSRFAADAGFEVTVVGELVRG